MAAVTSVVECPRNPGVETALRCSRCDTPICPKCLIQSPVGARCKDCARLTKSPVYTLSTAHILRAGAAALVGGLVMGIIWVVVLRPLTYGFLSIFLGAGLGWVFTRAMELATGRKRGPLVMGFAMGGIALAWATLLVFDPDMARFGLLAAGIGMYLAYQNLR